MRPAFWPRAAVALAVADHARRQHRAEAQQIVEWYRQRWNIEQLFWTLKRQGLDVEASQIETADGLSKLAFLATLAATRIMQLVHARDGATPIPAEEVFTAEEVEALRLQQPILEGRTAKQKKPSCLRFPGLGELDHRSPWWLERVRLGKSSRVHHHAPRAHQARSLLQCPCRPQKCA